MAATPPDVQMNDALEPQPISRPSRPRDRAVQRPGAPAYPPTVIDVLRAVQYNRDVDRSVSK
jgi:hypothetical protein